MSLALPGSVHNPFGHQWQPSTPRSNLRMRDPKKGVEANNRAEELGVGVQGMNPNGRDSRKHPDPPLELAEFTPHPPNQH